MGISDSFTPKETTPSWLRGRRLAVVIAGIGSRGVMLVRRLVGAVWSLRLALVVVVVMAAAAAVIAGTAARRRGRGHSWVACTFELVAT